VRLKRTYRSELNTLFVFETDDGYQVESVFYRGDTLCVSTQVGCPVGCAFCASGRFGFFRNLTGEEIFSQYKMLRDKLPVKGIAVAGIGEPAMNAGNVLKAVEMFKSEGLRVTLSTTGYRLDGFRRLMDCEHDGLTLSVHQFDEEGRRAIFRKSEPVSALIEALKEKLDGVSSRRRKRFQLGYLLLKGVNDDLGNLSELRRTASELNLTVMLMMYNEVEGIPFRKVSSREYEDAFRFLREGGVRVTLSNRFRTDPLGGCGTLTLKRN